MNSEDERDTCILIVDDDIDNVNILLDFLDKAGFRTMVSTDGVTAVDQAVQNKPDIILLDVMMPGLDGFETCRFLKKNEEVRDIPVIFMTALTETVNKVKGFEAGGVDYITKPFDVEEVLVRIKTHMTIQKLQHQILEKNLELRELNASKDKFFSILAHDLRNPMAVFLSFSKLLNNIEKMNKKELALYIKQFQESATNLFALLDNLLTWSRLQRGLVEFSPKALKIYTLVNWNIKLLEPYIWQKKIVIKNFVGDNIFINADENMVNSIIRNLISNAVKFNNTGGTIEIKAEQGDLDVHIIISDTGIGIAQSVLPNLFRIDSRTKQPGTMDERGTGLGLILCKEFTEKNGGKIWIESEPGAGTIVHLTLPLSV